MRCDALALIAGVAAVAGCGTVQPQIHEAGMVIRDAHVVGKYEACGGPYPGHCWLQRTGTVSASRGPRHRVVAVQRLADGRFSFHLPPGKYTLTAVNSAGARWHTIVNAVAGKTTRANIIIPIP